MTANRFSIKHHIRSEMLGVLRDVEVFRKLLGPIAQFVIVVDANIILGDLLWLVTNRKKPDATTQLMECINAGTVVAYITRSVLAEVNEHIPGVAADKGISEDAIQQEWKVYRKLIKVKTPRKNLVDRYKDGQDPDDAPTVALEKMLGADGILSKDSDIVAMGGLVIEIDFMSMARDYSRKTAVRATILFAGGTALTVSWGIIFMVAQSIKSVVAWFRGLPALTQIIILLAVIVIASDKTVQKRVADMIRKVSSIKNSWPQIMSLLTLVSTTLAENTVPPPAIQYVPKKQSAPKKSKSST